MVCTDRRRTSWGAAFSGSQQRAVAAVWLAHLAEGAGDVDPVPGAAFGRQVAGVDVAGVFDGLPGVSEEVVDGDAVQQDLGGAGDAAEEDLVGRELAGDLPGGVDQVLGGVAVSLLRGGVGGSGQETAAGRVTLPCGEGGVLGEFVGGRDRDLCGAGAVAGAAPGAGDHAARLGEGQGVGSGEGCGHRVVGGDHGESVLTEFDQETGGEIVELRYGVGGEFGVVVGRRLLWQMFLRRREEAR